MTERGESVFTFDIISKIALQAFDIRIRIQRELVVNTMRIDIIIIIITIGSIVDKAATWRRATAAHQSRTTRVVLEAFDIIQVEILECHFFFNAWSQQ
jgi:hypothetical protein